MYFQKFPDIYYEYDIGGEPVLKVVKDITRNIRFRKAILENITLFDEYDIQDGETPEIVAAKVYGSSVYHWVIMLANQRHDYATEWPMGYHTLNTYIIEKYTDPNAIHHYENAAGFIVMSDAEGAQPITNYQAEVNINETKRRIKLISPALLTTILSQFKDIM